MHDVANSRADAHGNDHDDFMEAPVEGVNSGACSGETAPFTEEDRSGRPAGASLDLIDFGNRLDYYLRTWDNRAWTAPGPGRVR